MVQAKSVSLQNTRLFQSYKYMSSIVASMIVGDSTFSVLTANPTIPSFLVGALVVLVLAIIGMSCWKFGSTNWLGANS